MRERNVSEPITDNSSGTHLLRPAAARIAPIAIRSFVAKIAVTSGFARSNPFAASYPLSMESCDCTMTSDHRQQRKRANGWPVNAIPISRRTNRAAARVAHNNCFNGNGVPNQQRALAGGGNMVDTAGRR